ncbi:hypothetical protein GCM10027416_22220 [Okibacterium endophyticum]
MSEKNETDAKGTSSDIGRRISGEDDPKNPDGLLTLDDLPHRTGDASDLASLIDKTRSYGEGAHKDTAHRDTAHRDTAHRDTAHRDDGGN